MPPRIQPLAAPLRGCNASSMSSMVQRFAAASISTTARLSVPRRNSQSSGASFIEMDESSRNSGSSSSRDSTSAALGRVLFDSETRRRMTEKSEERRRSLVERMSERKVSEDYYRYMLRRWKIGEVYAPKDISPMEMAQVTNRSTGHPTRRDRKKQEGGGGDVMDMLGVNPLDEYRNFALISEYVSPVGRIRHSDQTGLRPVNQRRMAKAIRRAIGMGIHPSVHKHPEILATEWAVKLGGPENSAGWRKKF